MPLRSFISLSWEEICTVIMLSGKQKRPSACIAAPTWVCSPSHWEHTEARSSSLSTSTQGTCSAEVIGRGAKGCPLLVPAVKCPAVAGSLLVTWQTMENMKHVTSLHVKPSHSETHVQPASSFMGFMQSGIFIYLCFLSDIYTNIVYWICVDSHVSFYFTFVHSFHLTVLEISKC